MTRERFAIHRVIVDGRYRYFGTVKEAKAAAVEVMRSHGGKGFVYESLTMGNLVDTLNDPPSPEPTQPEGEARALADEILRELVRARTKFPGDNVTMLALMEEVGELAKASFEESRDRVRKEAVQVATMAMRVVLDGDSTLDGWRSTKGLDALTPAQPVVSQEEK